MLLYGLEAEAEMPTEAIYCQRRLREPEFMIGLFIFLLLLLTAFSWWRLVKAREQARFAAGAACKQHGLVLMDDTVMLHDVQLKKEDPVRAWGFRYHFDYARDGILHHGGTVLLSPGQGAIVVIDTDTGQLIERLRHGAYPG